MIFIACQKIGGRPAAPLDDHVRDHVLHLFVNKKVSCFPLPYHPSWFGAKAKSRWRPAPMQGWRGETLSFT